MSLQSESSNQGSSSLALCKAAPATPPPGTRPKQPQKVADTTSGGAKR